ncbi:hypothetical protein DEU29_102200 [Idiomarina aquatica]|uniref:Uncharacterized protein n=1 Tax=Idiomarina aquatica TaxID=1327752 RepID=A0A4V3CQ84_9GAMM|nr:DUF692 domain-containing protein [Idiomarina aquatica]TDP40300.1 hypothetical protein DEU29_102200 [Idiomarina aquatica]
MTGFNSVPVRSLGSGIGLSFKADFYDAVMSLEPSAFWFEVHTENYCAVGGPRRRMLAEIAERFAVSLHGVAGSLGNSSHDPHAHLKQVNQLVRQINPALVSEHVAWSMSDHEYFADLLPIKRTQQALQTLVNNIDRYQNAVGRQILIENPTHYVDLLHDCAEPEFMLEVTQRSGCGLLMDLTNLYLSQINCGIDAGQYIRKIPANAVGELHVAGFEPDVGVHGLLIDSHSQPVPDAIKDLLSLAYQQWGDKPTLLERDANLPAFSELQQEAQQLLDIKEDTVHAIA